MATSKRKKPKTKVKTTVRKRRKRPIYREVWGAILFILGLCVLAGHFQSDAILINWCSVLFRGLVGYGSWTAFPTFLLASWILLFHHGRPVKTPLICTFLIPVLAGSLGHLLHHEQSVSVAGLSTLLFRLWETGQNLTSGGLISGILASLGEAFLSRPVSILLCVCGIIFLLFQAMRQSPGQILAFLRSAPEYEEEPLPPSRGKKSAVSAKQPVYRLPKRRQETLPPEKEKVYLPGMRETGNGFSRGDGNSFGRGDGDFFPGNAAPVFSAAEMPYREPSRNGNSRNHNTSRSNARDAEAETNQPGFFPHLKQAAVSRFSGLSGIVSQKLSGLFSEDDTEDDTTADVIQHRASSDEPEGVSLKKKPVSGESGGGKKSATVNKKSGTGRTSGTESDSAQEGEGTFSPENTESTPEPVQSSRAAPGKHSGKTSESGKLSGKEFGTGQGRGRKNKNAGDVAAQKDAVAEQIARNQSGQSDAGRKPNIDLLTRNTAVNRSGTEAELNRDAVILQNTLKSFDVPAELAGYPVRGPSVTRYDFQLKQGVKLSKITNLADDIALALGSTGVRIAPIPSRNSVVGIEVPNRQTVPVLIRDVLEEREFYANSSDTAFAVGKDVGGRCIVGSIEQLPHVLIAGTTGSGKSVCINSLIVSLLYKSTPDKVKFIMIDPKMVELAPYNDIPHLLHPVVTDPKKAAGALQWAVGEMMKRYRVFSENGVKNLKSYNRLTKKRKELESMFTIVLVIDELADLMLAAAKEVEESIIRVAQMGRAAGIHLVIATQRPSADVITGLMKANIPSRIAFAVASSMESRIILDTAGAEKLMGRGDMLYAPLGESRIRVQGCYISPEEIEQVIAFIKETGQPHYDNAVTESIEASGQETEKSEKVKPVSLPAEDDLLPAAVDIVLESGQASVSLLQRRLKLGYSRAARLVDQMEEKGYVGPFEGSRPRQILITPEQWHSTRP